MIEQTVRGLTDARLAVAISQATDTIEVRQARIDDMQVQQRRTHETLRRLHAERDRRMRA